ANSISSLEVPMTLRGRFPALFGLSLFLLSVGFASRAQAIPAFARKYGMACTACHEAWPKLNAQGWAFRDNGYQWMAGKDNPITLNPAYWPIAVRTTVGYQYQSLTNQPSNAGNIAVNTGRIGTSGIDLLFAGTLTNNVSFLLVIEPQLTNVGFTTGIMTDPALITAPGEVGLVESLWVRFDNIFGSPYLNFKIGRG